MLNTIIWSLVTRVEFYKFYKHELTGHSKAFDHIDAAYRYSWNFHYKNGCSHEQITILCALTSFNQIDEGGTQYQQFKESKGKRSGDVPQ